MGVHISKDILYDDAYDKDDDTHSILSSHERLDQLRRKRATCAADLSSEMPILLKRGGSRNRMKHQNTIVEKLKLDFRKKQMGQGPWLETRS